MKKVLKKLNKAVGFTLVETVLAVAMLAIVSAAILPAAIQAYQKAVDAANARALLTIAVDALRDEFSMARAVKIETTGGEGGTKVIVYQNADTGGKSKIYIDKDSNNNEIIMRQEYREHSDNSWVFDLGANIKKPDTYQLISTVLTNNGTTDPKKQMVVTFDMEQSDVKDGLVKIHDLRVERGGHPIVSMPVDLVIHYLELGGETT